MTTMNAIEKRFMREYVDECLTPHGVSKKLWPEMKADALGRFRRVQKSRASTLADEAVSKFVETVCPVMHPPK